MKAAIMIGQRVIYYYARITKRKVPKSTPVSLDYVLDEERVGPLKGRFLDWGMKYERTHAIIQDELTGENRLIDLSDFKFVENQGNAQA